jgi:hypothetical protein
MSSRIITNFWCSLYRVIQVLPPDRKHPLLIDLKLSKNLRMMVWCVAVEYSVKISIFLMKQVNILRDKER